MGTSYRHAARACLPPRGTAESSPRCCARGLPDGSAVDAEGYLWNCRFFGGCIVRVAPDGQIDRVVEMPVNNITTCTFGGPDRKTLYVTTASIQAPPSDRLAGSLYAIDTEVAGQPENRFCLFGRAG